MPSSSTPFNHHQLSSMHVGATAAPPPTPSCTYPNSINKSETAADALSSLFHRLPPNLSLPNRRYSFTAAESSIVSLPTVSLNAADKLSFDDLISAATDFGYFQLTNDDSDITIPHGLAEAAESESFSLLDLNEEKKESSFPKNWPLGYETDAETPSYCLDADCSTESSELNMSSLREFTRTLEKVGVKTVEMLVSALGFEYESNRFKTLMWLNQDVTDDKPEITNGFYPFVVCLQYQIREEKYCLLTESGWVSVLPRVDSVLVTLGDIAQVWRNGEVKRVRYRPVLCARQNGGARKSVTMTLMLTLPMDALVSPVKAISDGDKEEEFAEEEDEDGEEKSDEGRVFRSFSFEEYAWRVYHERLFFKDPLDRYKIKSHKDF